MSVNSRADHFDLKHRVLEQFSEGSYEGIFIITRVFNQAVTWKNGTWTKLCADLDWEALKILAQSDDVGGSDSLAVAQLVAEAQDDAVHHHEPAAKQDSSAEANPSSKSSNNDEAVYDREVLSQLVMSGTKYIKLDATMEDRDLFREFREVLRNAGYRFDGRSQSWFFPDAA